MKSCDLHTQHIEFENEAKMLALAKESIEFTKQ